MRRRARQFGFTLIELMIVISIMIILLSIATTNYTQSILHARESVLQQDLRTLRDTIDQYTYDKKKAPQALDDLVTAGYIRAIPKDPFTHQADWVADQETDVLQSIDQSDSGIVDVHSASDLTGSDGTAYNTW
jgi:general secretion pathway protein G